MRSVLRSGWFLRWHVAQEIRNSLYLPTLQNIDIFFPATLEYDTPGRFLVFDSSKLFLIRFKVEFLEFLSVVELVFRCVFEISNRLEQIQECACVDVNLSITNGKTTAWLT